MPHPDMREAEELLERLQPLLADAGLRATLAAAAVESVSLRGVIQMASLALDEIADDCERMRGARDANQTAQDAAFIARWEQ